MLASIRWRGEDPPATPKRWEYVDRSLRMSSQIDEQEKKKDADAAD